MASPTSRPKIDVNCIASRRLRPLGCLPSFAEAANRVVSPPITVREVRAYYRGDARLWTLLQALRRADRWWQLKVRRRPYPFLLPGKIER